MSLRNTTHKPYCDCFDCQDGYIQSLIGKGRKADFIQPTGRTDFAELTVKPASHYLDSTLVAKIPVTMYKTPDEKSDVVFEFPKGANMGIIKSYVVRNGNVWWELFWFSGCHAGWVKHQPGLFDSDIAEETSSGNEHLTTVKNLNDKANELDVVGQIGKAANDLSTGVTKAVSGTGDFLGTIGDNLKYIAIAAVVVVIIYAILKLNSK